MCRVWGAMNATDWEWLCSCGGHARKFSTFAAAESGGAGHLERSVRGSHEVMVVNFNEVQ